MTVAPMLLDALPPPPGHAGLLGKIRRIFFPTRLNALISVLCLVGIALSLKPLLSWTIFDAVWSGTAEQCRAQEQGACWAFIFTKLRFMIFGFYPADEHWRPGLTMAICFGMVLASMMPRFWRPGLFYAWGVALLAMLALMYGGVFGLPVHETRQWGGLPLTFLLSTVGLVGAFPVGVLLALGRRSKLPLLRIVSVAYIELIRGVPLVTVLFMASILFPLLLPEGLSIDKLLRAQVALIMFAAAYIAEIVRGGLQAMPQGQFEAAKSLGLGYALTMRKIILPQALKIVIPSLVNTAIGFFKDTTLVIIIGLFDFFTTIKAALTDPNWLGFHLEAYVFAAAVYFCFCFGISRYGIWFERKVAPERKR